METFLIFEKDNDWFKLFFFFNKDFLHLILKEKLFNYIFNANKLSLITKYDKYSIYVVTNIIYRDSYRVLV